MSPNQRANQTHYAFEPCRHAVEDLVNKMICLQFSEDETREIVRVGCLRDIIVPLLEILKRGHHLRGLAKIYEWGLRIEAGKKISDIIGLPIHDFIVRYCELID